MRKISRILRVKVLIFSFVSFALGMHVYAQSDSAFVSLPDTIVNNIPEKNEPKSDLGNLLSKNTFIDAGFPTESLIIIERNTEDNDLVFYGIIVLFFLFGIFKTIFSKYFNTMFRVFFNTSLRQSQLTDQLMQAKLPSLIFNILFISTAAFYISLLLNTTDSRLYSFSWAFLLMALICFIIIYIVKYLTLKFIGWITGYNQEADTYIFIIFLINKIVGICLLPVLIILAFSDPLLVRVTVILSFVFIGVMLMLRFLRSYGLLQHKLSVNGFHFLLYILAMEILPIALIYKAAMLYMGKNL